MKQLVDLTLEEIINHPEFVSIEKIVPYKPMIGPTMYQVTFEATKRYGKPGEVPKMDYWLTCDDRKILTKRYTFFTHLIKPIEDGRFKDA